ncbi:hypothetical protein [Lamprobacter sp.]|uniref:hypothetical protein n=1 Tax=Lamprobacter sp. TaxID=3100796 RepID=UPI002B260CD8|nr:hypothetical protein [Lamprobacter sp.]
MTSDDQTEVDLALDQGLVQIEVLSSAGWDLRLGTDETMQRIEAQVVLVVLERSL